MRNAVRLKLTGSVVVARPDSSLLDMIHSESPGGDCQVDVFMSEVAKQLAKFIRELHDRPPHLLCTVKAILSNASKIWPTAWKNFTEAVAADALKKKVGAISIAPHR